MILMLMLLMIHRETHVGAHPRPLSVHFLALALGLEIDPIRLNLTWNTGKAYQTSAFLFTPVTLGRWRGERLWKDSHQLDSSPPPHHNHLLFVSNPPQIFATTRNPRVCQHNNKWDQIWKFHKEIEMSWCDKQIVHTLIFSWIVSSFGETYSTDSTFCFAFPYY